MSFVFSDRPFKSHTRPLFVAKASPSPSVVRTRMCGARAPKNLPQTSSATTESDCFYLIAIGQSHCEKGVRPLSCRPMACLPGCRMCCGLAGCKKGTSFYCSEPSKAKAQGQKRPHIESFAQIKWSNECGLPLETKNLRTKRAAATAIGAKVRVPLHLVLLTSLDTQSSFCIFQEAV